MHASGSRQRAKRAVIVGGALVGLTVGTTPAVAAEGFGSIARATGSEMASATPEIVVLNAEGSVAAVTSAIHVQPTNIYSSALTGFSANLSVAQIAALERRADVASVQADRSFSTSVAEASPSSLEALAGNDVPQVVTRGVRRVGIMASPTAAVDGHGPGVNATIAILDTGIDPHHPDLKVVGGYNCTSANHAKWADDNGHGTLVAGVAAARDNDIDIVGVAPGARLWAIKVLNAQGIGTDSALLCGADWLAAHAGRVDVANMSFGGQPDGSPPGERFNTKDCGRAAGDLFHEVLCRVHARGVVLVAGAGNDAENAALSTPAAYPEVITVSGIVDSDGAPGGLGGPDPCLGEPDDTFASFSDFGSPIDIAAPAVCISSTYPEPDAVATDSGTSYAAPFVTGAVALLRARHPHMSPKQVERILKHTASPGPISGDPDHHPEGVLNVAGY
jgi:subtilisin